MMVYPQGLESGLLTQPKCVKACMHAKRLDGMYIIICVDRPCTCNQSLIYTFSTHPQLDVSIVVLFNS